MARPSLLLTFFSHKERAMVLRLHWATLSIDYKKISSSYPQLKPAAGVHRLEATQGKEKPPREMTFVRCTLFETKGMDWLHTIP